MASTRIPVRTSVGAPVSEPSTSTQPTAGTAPLARGLAAVSLFGLVLLSLLTVVISAERPSFLTPASRPGFFPDWMAGPLRGLLPSLTSSSSKLAWLSSGLICVMYVLYALASSTVARLRARWTIAATVAIHIAFLLSPPLSYTDVFNYLNYGRMGVVHGLNPYAVVPLLEPHSDPSFALSNWHLLLSPYGPLFTLMTYALVPLGVASSFWALKAILMVASLATLALVWKCAELVGRSPAAAIVLVGCNPIVLVWGLGADHNDVLMLFFIVLGAYLLVRQPSAESPAAAALVAAVFVKASAAVLLPIYLFAASSRPRFLAGGAAALAVLSAASLLAFGAHLPGLGTQDRLVTGLALPNLLGLALGLGGETRGLHAVVTVLALAAVGACAYSVGRRRGDWLTASGWALVALIVSLSWTVPWYLLWALPFAALSRSSRLRAAVLLLGAYLIVAFVPAAPMLVNATGLNPTSTRLGMEHRREIERLVR